MPDTTPSVLHPPLAPDFEAAVMARIATVRAMKQMHMSVVSLAEGYCRMRMAHDPQTDGIFGSFHGGLLMAAADTAACWAVLTKTGPHVPLTTTDMNIRFLAPCMTDVIAAARVIKAGRTMNPVAVDLFDESGKLVAVAQVNYMILTPKPA